jgi:hypothetical protein
MSQQQQHMPHSPRVVVSGAHAQGSSASHLQLPAPLACPSSSEQQQAGLRSTPHQSVLTSLRLAGALGLAPAPAAVTGAGRPPRPALPVTTSNRVGYWLMSLNSLALQGGQQGQERRQAQGACTSAKQQPACA